MSEQPSVRGSPRWTNTTKLIVALVFTAAVIGLFLKFQSFIVPLLVAFIIAYLFHPIAETLTRKFHFPWRVSVVLIYFLTILIVAGLLTVSGIALVSQIQSLIDFIQTAIRDLPGLISQWTTEPIIIGPFVLDLAEMDLSALVNEILGSIQPILSQIGSLVGSIASGAFEFIGWLFFSLIISYFVLAETGGVRERLIHLDIPGYTEDLRKIGIELSRIWNAFLRGQLILFLITLVTYNVLLGGLGVKYFYGLSIMAGLARFVPYVGPWITWITYGLVTYFQGTTIFGLSPLVYSIIVIGLAVLVDNIIDTFVSPNLMANALQLHPAAVMVGALVGLNLFGVIGMILAAPTLATLKLGFDYATAKLMDQDPWYANMSKLSDAEQIETKRKRLAKNAKSAISKVFKKKNYENGINKNMSDKPIESKQGDQDG